MTKNLKRKFLEQMDKVEPQQAPIDLISPYDPEEKKERPPILLASMSCMYFLQHWFTLLTPALRGRSLTSHPQNQGCRATVESG